MSLRKSTILQLQKFLKQRYNKHIVEIKNPFTDMQRLMQGIQVGGIIDGGGYHGEIALRLSNHFPSSTIYPFEPSKKSFEILSNNVQANTKIRPNNLALSSKPGTHTLFVNAQDSTNSLSPVGEGGKKYQSWQTENKGTEEITMVTLDGWAAEKGVHDIHIVKLDLQGHELEALQGAEAMLRSTVKLIYTEVEFVKIYEQNCLYFEVEAYLQKFGFELFQFYDLSDGEDGRLVCGDAIFIVPDRMP